MLVCQIEVQSTSTRHFGAVLLLLFACLCLEDTKVVVAAGLHLHPEAIRDTQSLLQFEGQSITYLTLALDDFAELGRSALNLCSEGLLRDTACLEFLAEYFSRVYGS